MVAGYNQRAEICTATFDLFLKILAGEIGNMALKLMATGGIYLEVASRRGSWTACASRNFSIRSAGKAALKNLLDSIPAYVILDPEVTLHGAAFEALALLTAQVATL